jgi:hypothetical protein
MADHDEVQPDAMRRRLEGLASGIEVGDAAQARASVDGVVGRRRVRRRVGAALGAAAVVAVAATTVVLTLGDSDPDTFVTSDDTMAPDISSDTTEADAPVPTLDLATGPSVEVVEGVAQPGSVPGTNGAPEYGEWVVPWDEGFLVGSTWSPPQPLPEELPDEVIALFPQEVIDLFGGDLPATIAEATDQLSAAGLLDVVSTIILDNPAAYDAIYGAPTEAPTLEVRYTVDGRSWEAREFTPPADATYLSSVTAVGDRLAVVYSLLDPLTGAPLDGTITVATTTDLTTWTTQDIEVPSPGELPAGIDWSVFAQGLVANDSGWMLSVYSSVDVDPLSLLPGDVRDEIDASNGLGTSFDSAGITVEYDFDETGSNPGQTLTFGWDELGIAPEFAQLLGDQDYSPTYWSASWDGVPVPTDAPIGAGPLAATPAGFVLWNDQTWFSTDGVVWASAPLPDGVASVGGAFAIDGGLILLASSERGEPLVVRVDERGGNASTLDLELGVSGSLSSTTPFAGTATNATIVVADPPVSPEDQLTVELDGYRLTQVGFGGIFEVTEVATGEVVVSEGLSFGDDEGSIRLDDDGSAITVLDPATGEVLVVFTEEVLQASEEAYFDDGGGEYDPDFVLIGSVDGERFLVDEIDDAFDGPTSVATNGDRLLLQSAGDWSLYELP